MERKQTQLCCEGGTVKLCAVQMCVAINAMPDNMVQTNNIMTIFFSFVSNEYRQKENENESSFGLKGFIISFFWNCTSN